MRGQELQASKLCLLVFCLDVIRCASARAMLAVQGDFEEAIEEHLLILESKGVCGIDGDQRCGREGAEDALGAGDDFVTEGQLCTDLWLWALQCLFGFRSRKKARKIDDALREWTGCVSAMGGAWTSVPVALHQLLSPYLSEMVLVEAVVAMMVLQEHALSVEAVCGIDGDLRCGWGGGEDALPAGVVGAGFSKHCHGEGVV